MKPVPTLLAIIAAMFIGAGLAYYLMRPAGDIPPGANAGPSFGPPPEGLSSIRPPIEPRMLRDKPALDQASLEAAVAAAKAARRRGELKPLASTPEEFARELGAFNYRLFELATRFPEPPDTTAPESAEYATRLEQLTNDYANLVSDDELLSRIEDDTPDALANLQAHLATGSLGLDAAGTATLKANLQRVYAELFPLDEAAPEADGRLETATAEITQRLSEQLTPEQQQRLELMGINNVLFGLPHTEE